MTCFGFNSKGYGLFIPDVTSVVALWLLMKTLCFFMIKWV